MNSVMVTVILLSLVALGLIFVVPAIVNRINGNPGDSVRGHVLTEDGNVHISNFEGYDPETGSLILEDNDGIYVYSEYVDTQYIPR